MTPEEAFADLTERLEKAAQVLSGMADSKRQYSDELDYERLRGKLEGVRLSLDYVRQYTVKQVDFGGC